MKRRLPFFTPVAVAFTIIVIASLGFAIWKSGGQSFNPGSLSALAQPGVLLQGFASHASFEAECSLCHQPLTTTQEGLCTRCHRSILSQAGLHSQIDGGTSCFTCHPDHRGRDFNPTNYALANFNHEQTSFSLTGAHTRVTCDRCHPNGEYRLSFSSSSCVACHSDEQAHPGLFSQDCAACHTTQGWAPAQYGGKPFNHADTPFALDLHANDTTGQSIRCASCHAGGVSAAQTLPECIQCHSAADPAKMSAHVDQFGSACLDCHDGQDRMVPFDHAGYFPLEGQHASLACADCHTPQKYTDAPTQCSGCHDEPDIHAGSFGLQCQDCHTSSAWKPALLRVHPFPIDHGGRGNQTCQTCHEHSYPQYTCYSCHDHQPEQIANSHKRAGITAADLPDCVRCHPSGAQEQNQP
ncbi:MAG: hypothetical protein M1281_10210 [Chloroflexi bacterium]|nr:hypothetical protein [Chloroflexota bacterium]